MSQERQWVMLDPANGAGGEDEAEDVAMTGVPAAAAVATAASPVAEPSAE